MSEKIVRAYGSEMPIGDILWNKTEKTVYFFMNGGVFGIQKILLMKNEEGTYNMMKSYISKNGEPSVVNIGRTFPVKRNDGTVVEGITQATLSLGSKWDNELKREVSDNSNALYITTHKLREEQVIKENIVKVGYIKGRFGIKIEENSSTAKGDETKVPDNSPQPHIVDDSDEVPF